MDVFHRNKASTLPTKEQTPLCRIVSPVVSLKSFAFVLGCFSFSFADSMSLDIIIVHLSSLNSYFVVISNLFVLMLHILVVSL